MSSPEYWMEEVSRIYEGFRDEAIDVLANRRTGDCIWVRDLLRAPALFIEACRTANIETDEVVLLKAFASGVFQHLCD